jgi:hypothetical protein
MERISREGVAGIKLGSEECLEWVPAGWRPWTPVDDRCCEIQQHVGIDDRDGLLRL